MVIFIGNSPTQMGVFIWEIPSGNDQQFANLKMVIYIVYSGFTHYKWWMFNSYV